MKGFRLAGRVMPFSVFDVALFTRLAATGKVVTFVDVGSLFRVGWVD